MSQFFLDSNIWIRYVVATDKQSLIATKVIETIVNSSHAIIISNIVLMELYFVLKSVYRVPANKIIADIKNILSVKKIKLIDKTIFNTAFLLHQQTKIKLTDCLIATQVPSNCTLITFDQDFKKIPHLKTLTPKEFVQKYKANKALLIKK